MYVAICRPRVYHACANTWTVKIITMLHEYTYSRSIVPISVEYVFIIESVDSISRDGPDTPIYVIHYKKPKISEQVSL